MKLIATLLFVTTAFAQNAPVAATVAPAKPHPATHPAASAATAAHGCVKLPEISPKVPALPPGAPCAKTLYTLTAVPSIKVEYSSPMEGPSLQQILGLETSSFSLNYVETKVGVGALTVPHKWLTINYSGYLVDGTKFDSSFNPGRGPFVIQYGEHKAIPGWDTGFAGMKVGGKRRLFIPWQLAYGARGNPPTIPAQANLIFDVELLAQSDTEPTPPKAPPTPPAASTPTVPRSGAGQPAPAAQPATTTPPPAAPATPPPATPPAATTPLATPPTSTPPKPQ